VTYGGDSGNRILYWRCSLIRVSVIRGSTVYLFLKSGLQTLDLNLVYITSYLFIYINHRSLYFDRLKTRHSLKNISKHLTCTIPYTELKRIFKHKPPNVHVQILLTVSYYSLHRHVSATLVTIFRVSYSNNTINTLVITRT
jgi:hypothetical protein